MIKNHGLTYNQTQVLAAYQLVKPRTIQCIAYKARLTETKTRYILKNLRQAGLVGKVQ